MIAKKLRISGKVQDVCYRASTKEQADRLGVVGWVTNNDDGSVSAFAQGTEEAVLGLITWCHSGPEAAEVTTVDTEDCTIEEHVTFEIHR